MRFDLIRSSQKKECSSLPPSQKPRHHHPLPLRREPVPLQSRLHTLPGTSFTQRKIPDTQPLIHQPFQLRSVHKIREIVPVLHRFVPSSSALVFSRKEKPCSQIRDLPASLSTCSAKGEPVGSPRSYQCLIRGHPLLRHWSEAAPRSYTSLKQAYPKHTSTTPVPADVPQDPS